MNTDSEMGGIKMFQDGHTNSSRMEFWTQVTAAGSTNKMTILQDGNVGIGKTDPNSSLYVCRGSGAGGTAVFVGTTHASHFNYSTSEATYIRGGKSGSVVTINDSHNGNVCLAIGGGEIHTGSGNVGIGTTSPQNLLHVYQAPSSNYEGGIPVSYTHLTLPTILLV